MRLKVFGNCTNTRINNAKPYTGPVTAEAGALELAGNLASIGDGVVHPTINVDNWIPTAISWHSGCSLFRAHLIRRFSA